MTQPASITYWNRVEPSPRGESLRPGLTAAVRDPLWFLTRQWQLGEFQGEDAASPAYVSITMRSGELDGWQTGTGPTVAYNAGVPLEVVTEREPQTPDLRTAIELGQALERRLSSAGLSGAIGAFRQAHPLPAVVSLSAAQQRDSSLVRLLRVCATRCTDGVAVLAAAPTVPPLPSGVPATDVAAVLEWFTGWAAATFGVIGTSDPVTWSPERLEYALQVTGSEPAGSRVGFTATPGTHGEFDWYAFDETSRTATGAQAVADPSVSLLPAPVRFSGMPDPRWWNFEDARFNWSDVDTDRRDVARLLVIDFMLVQGTDWYVIPLDHAVGSLASVHQLLVRDVFGGYTLVSPTPAPWRMFATTGARAGNAVSTHRPAHRLRPPPMLRCGTGCRPRCRSTGSRSCLYRWTRHIARSRCNVRRCSATWTGPWWRSNRPGGCSSRPAWPSRSST
jgi:hypothetical protein